MSLKCLQLVWLLLCVCCLIHGLDAQSGNCTAEEISDCGDNAVCSNGLCTCETLFFSPSGSDMDCRSIYQPDPVCGKYDEDCVFCGTSYEGPCMLCTIFLDQESCVDNCTGEFRITLIDAIGTPASVCEVTDMSGILALPQWAIIVIIVGVVLIVVTTTVIFISLMVRILHKSSRGVFEVEATHNEAMDNTMRTKRSNSFSFKNNSKDDSIVHQNEYGLNDFNKSKEAEEEEEEEEDEIDGDDETVFKYKMDKLRTKSETFLQMLNDMRRRARELPEGSPAEEQYRKVMRDVTRLLYLLNKKPSRIKMPPDGVELMRWSEKILKRYLASQEKERTLRANEEPSYMSSGHTGTSDENVFLGKLAFLRDHSEVFLRMLNEMRRRLKEFRPESPTAQNYKAITKDVTRLLELLNKPPDDVEMPEDGLELVIKSEQLLERYLASQGFIPNYQQTEVLGLYGLQDITQF